MLINAAEQGRTSLVRRYLEDGADASATSKDGDTLAIFAAGVGNVPMLVYILELSPELAVKPNEGGLQPLHAAAMQVGCPCCAPSWKTQCLYACIC